MKKILVLGGTNFIGRVLVETLLQEKEAYTLTLFNRGKTNPDLFPTVRKLQGDRRKIADLACLAQEDWDVVLDISGYYPLPLQALVNCIKDRCKRYVFVSTASVYDMDKIEGDKAMAEDFPLLSCTTEQMTDTTMATYGERKVACEQVLLTSLPNVIILRPSVVYGKYDPYDRHYYWLYRLKKSTQVLMPTSVSLLTCTYVYDLVRALIQSIHIEKHHSIYNVSTDEIYSFGQSLQAMQQGLGSTATLVPVSEVYLAEQGIREWQDLPLWTNKTLLFLSSNKLMQDYDFSFTPLVAATKAWATYYDTIGWSIPKSGISLEKEQFLLQEAL